MKTIPCKTAFSTGAGLCAFIAAAPLAQAQGPTVPAQASVAPRNIMEEIVVSAQRRDEMQQNVPAAITAISGKDVESKRIQTGQDLQQFVPSLSISSTGGRNGNVYNLRGQGTTFSAGPGVVVYFNEVPLPFDNFTSTNGGGPGLYFDLQNLQVLKGPQGTLFGRNTTGGAILLQPQEPTEQLEGFLDVGVGNYNNCEYQGVLNVPVVGDKLLVRIAGSGQTRDGYTRNVVDGVDFDNRDAWAYRISVSLRPSDTLQSDFVYYRNRYRMHGSGIELAAVNFGINPATQFPYPIVLLYGADRLQQALADQLRRGEDKTAIDSYSAEKSLTWGVLNITRWDISDALTLRNIASYQELQAVNGGDADGTAIPIINSRVSGHTANYTEELQLQGSSFDERLDWTAGGYLEYVRPKGVQRFFAASFEDTLFPIPGAAPSIIDQRVGTTQRSKALYAQGTYNLGGIAAALEDLKLTAGYRYTWDTRRDRIDALSVDSDSSAATWTLGLDYPLTPETLVYVKSSRGYKGGGANVSSNDPSRLTFDPEYVRDVEAGLKRDWIFGAVRARTNIAVFRTDFSDIQKTIGTFYNNIPGSATANVARAKIDGVEFEGALQPSAAFALSLSYSYLKARYVKGDAGFDENLPFSFAPKNKINVAATYFLPLSRDLGDASLTASYAYTSSTFGSSSVRQPGDTIDSYGLVNLSAEWNRIADGPFDASLFVTNATNEVYVAGAANTFYNILGFNSVLYGEPRMFGARVRYHF